MTDQFSLDDRVVLITGSSQGIGLALATACAEAGAHVVINARSSDKIDAAVAMLRDRGHQATGHAADVTDQEHVEDMVVVIERDVGPIAGLINNAGIQRRAPFLDFALDDYRQVMETNLVAPFLVAQSVGRRMAERRAGPHHQHRVGAVTTWTPDDRAVRGQQGWTADDDPRHVC